MSLEFINATEIQPEPVRWLWNEIIPLGGITVFVGPPDTGKNLAAFDIAARITTGTNFPNVKNTLKPSEVLVINPENESEDIIVPRLMAAGADLTRVHFLLARVTASPQIDVLEKALAAHPDIRMVIMDSFLSAIGDGVNLEAELRAILQPLKRLATSFNVAVVLITRLTSKAGSSSALTALARTVWKFQSVNDSDAPEKQSYTITRVKNNLAPPITLGFNFQIRVRPVFLPTTGETFVPYLCWGDYVRPESQRLGRPDTPKFLEAQAWLQDALQDGAVTAKKLFKDALDGAGIKADTVRAAGKALGIKPEKRAEGWLWELPVLNVTASAVEDDAEIQRDWELK
jgi:putative DNA primase/helicase